MSSANMNFFPKNKTNKNEQSSATKECSRDKEASSSSQNASSGCPVVVTNPMSVSVPNLASSDANQTAEPATATGLLETFAAMARRRTLGQSSILFSYESP